MPLKRRFICAFVFLAGLLLSSEAWVSVVPEYISLQKLVEKSSLIVIAQYVKPQPSPTEWKFKVREVLKGKLLKDEMEIVVRPANADLHEAIGNAREKNQPAPIPILETYQGKVRSPDFVSNAEVIVFLISINGKWQLAVEEAFEGVDRKGEIVKHVK